VSIPWWLGMVRGMPVTRREMHSGLPNEDVTIIMRDGTRIEHAAPPPDIASLRTDETAPSTRGVPAFVLHSIVVTASAIIGRRVLRLRLD
jgi:hypothetical protein